MQADQVGIRAVLMRGGSSRGLFIAARDLPADPDVRDRVLLRLYGSPDARQIDGVGGADPLTSKVAIVAPSSRADADVEYTFGQVGITEARVFYGGNCGNMLAGVGPFAIDEGMVPAVEPVTRVRIYTTNTGQVTVAEVPVRGGKAAVAGDCQIPGVPGRGARILLDFGACGGAMTGQILPTGRVRETWEANGRPVTVSLVDAATAFVFVRAGDVGLQGTELPAELEANRPAMAMLEQIRGQAAAVLGLCGHPSEARGKSPNVPRVAVVSPPAPYRAADGREVASGQCHVVGRQLAMQRPHQAFAVTGALCLAAAARIPGTVVHECCARPDSDLLLLGHPAGVMEVAIRVEPAGGTFRVTRAAVARTARRLMEGVALVPRSVFDPLPPT